MGEWEASPLKGLTVRFALVVENNHHQYMFLCRIDININNIVK
jgi:hypothetical protein